MVSWRASHCYARCCHLGIRMLRPWLRLGAHDHEPEHGCHLALHEGLDSGKDLVIVPWEEEARKAKGHAKQAIISQTPSNRGRKRDLYTNSRSTFQSQSSGICFWGTFVRDE